MRVAALIEQRAMFDRAEMTIHDRDRGLGIAGAQGGHDLAVFVDGAIGGMRPAVQRRISEQRETTSPR